MISEGPCDTEDWSNDAENSAFQKLEISAFLVLFRTEVISDPLIC